MTDQTALQPEFPAAALAEHRGHIKSQCGHMTPNDVAAAAEAAHRALDAVDDNWHYQCMQPDDGGPPSCGKGQMARRMLEEDVMPAVLQALVEAGWLPPPTPMTGADDLPDWERDLLERQATRDERFG